MTLNLLWHWRNRQFEDSEVVIRIRKLKTDGRYNGKRLKVKWQIMVDKALHRKQKIEQHKPTNNPCIDIKKYL
jgi:nitrogen fixation-related uncharacterized protein